MRKQFFLLLVLFVGLFSCKSGGQILAEANGYQFTQTDFDKELRFVEFVLNTKLSPQEIEMFKRQEINEFKKNPQQALANIQSLDQQMQQFYAFTDPLQIGVAQAAVIAAIYAQVQQMPETDVFKQLFNKYVHVLAIDPQFQIALTKEDIDGYFDYMEFIYSLYGNPVTFDRQTRDMYAQQFAANFYSADQQAKAMLVAMDLLSGYYIQLYNQLTPEQKQQFQQSLLAQTAQNTYNQGYNQGYDNYNAYNYGYDNSYSNGYNTNPNGDAGHKYTKEELDQIMQMMQQKMQMNNMMFNTMNNIMMMNHATTSNIISNIGSGDTYWDVVDY